MKKLFFFTACLFTLFVLHAQTDSTKPGGYQKPSMLSTRDLSNKGIMEWHYTTNDSQAVLVESLKAVSGPQSVYAQQIIPVEEIKAFARQKKKTVLKGGLIGFGIGTVTGVVTGLVMGTDRPGRFATTAKQKAIIGGASLGITGAIAGFFIGALVQKKFTIGGKKQTHRDRQGELMLRLVQK